jgi:AraC-like DNA-binding protein
MFPAQEHQLIDRSKEAQYYVAVFKPALIRRSCHAEAYAGLKRKNVEGGGVLHTRLDPAAFDLIRGTMDSMMEDALDADTLNREAGFGVNPDFRFEHGDPDALNAGLHHLLLLCWRSQRGRHSTEGAVALHPAVRKALDLLSANDGDQSLRQIARRCGVSEAYLSRVFARELGVPLSRYRNRLRLSRFLDLQRAPVHRTVTEAVYAAGFGSYAQFYKVFVQTYGCGPRDSLRGTTRRA